METLEAPAPEDVVPQQHLGTESGRLVQPDHSRVALRNVRDDLVHAQMIETVVEHQQLGVEREPASPVLHLPDEYRSKLAPAVPAVEVHDAHRAHRHRVRARPNGLWVGGRPRIASVDEPETAT